MTNFESTTRSTSPLAHVSRQPRHGSAGVLLGTIAATGALGLSAVFALAPTTEALMLVGALGLPWTLLAIAAAMSFSSSISHSRAAHGTLPARRAARVPTPAFRVAGATAALALLLLVGLVAQHAAPSASTPESGTAAQVAAADAAAD